MTFSLNLQKFVFYFISDFPYFLPVLVVDFCPFVCAQHLQWLCYTSVLHASHAEDALKPLQMGFGECPHTLLGYQLVD